MGVNQIVQPKSGLLDFGVWACEQVKQFAANLKGRFFSHWQAGARRGLQMTAVTPCFHPRLNRFL
jgi:hypothetical protein